MMAKRTTAVSLKRSCAHQRALRNFLKHAFTCQRPQLYIDQVPHRCTHKPLSYRRDGQTDGQTDGFSALYSRNTQQEKHANALPYSTVLLPVSHGYTTETAIVLILTFSPVFSVSVPLLLDVSSCSVPSSSWFAGAGRWFCLSIYNYTCI